MQPSRLALENRFFPWPGLVAATDPSRWTAASNYYLGARGYYDYIAQLTWLEDVNLPTPANMFNLNTAHTYNQALVDQAYSDGKWSTTTSHGECTGIDYLGQQNANGHLWVAPIGEVLKYIKVRDASQFSNYNRVGRTISFDVVHNLPTFQPVSITTPDPYTFLPVVFDNPVTLKIHILDTDSVLSVMMDDIPVVSYSVQTLDGTRYITFDAALNTTRHVVVNLAAPAPAISNISENPDPVELGASATFTATVIPAEGTSLGTVTLRVLAPESHDYIMDLVSGNQYAASFTPTQLGTYSYQVIATNSEDAASQSSPASFTVVDTTPPAWRLQDQTNASILIGEANNLSAEGLDIGGLGWATLATNESGVWQEFTWPVSDWWNPSWLNRVPILLTESAGLARTAETVDVLVSSDQFPGLANCAAELRMADAEKNELPVQVYDENSSGGTLTCHLLFQASLGANESRTYYIYYGNPAATAPTYTTDLTSLTAGNLLNVRNTFLNLDLDTGSGIVSRLQLPTGTNTNLPLSPQTDEYWGWHQICSSLDGNITGKNILCSGGTAPATGLVLTTVLDGPIVKEFVFTSQKGDATYLITYRFFANAPYYQYDLTLAGTTASVMNNYWYANGNFSRLGAGTSGMPASTYNTYGNGVDQIRMASFDTSIDYASIDGNDNDGTQLGGTDYRFPSASGLDLWVITGSSQAETELGLGRLAAPVVAVLGTEVEEAPETQYGSPANLNGAVVWTPAAFLWQNPAIPVGTDVQWRIKFCDLNENCASTNEMTFSIVAPTYELSVEKTGTGSGTVTSDPAGIDCGSTCSFDFSYNTDVTLTAVADSGSTFTGWSGAGCTGTGACEVTHGCRQSSHCQFCSWHASGCLCRRRLHQRIRRRPYLWL